MYMYHSFLIHSSADGHQGCFHVLAIINSAVLVGEKGREGKTGGRKKSEREAERRKEERRKN